VCSGGGVKTAEDIAGLLFLGAETVQIATEFILRGFERIKELNSETDELFVKAGITTAEKIKETGRNLYEPIKQDSTHPARMKARWNSEKCIIRKRPGDCYYCAHNNGHANGQAFCERIQYGLSKTITIAESCEGCGLCAQLCPHGAIEMMPIES
jgi:Pyruvate/2-oxoacid:ferredoxin oxidoreductase delta subunit